MPDPILFVFAQHGTQAPFTVGYAETDDARRMVLSRGFDSAAVGAQVWGTIDDRRVELRELREIHADLTAFGGVRHLPPIYPPGTRVARADGAVGKVMVGHHGAPATDKLHVRWDDRDSTLEDFEALRFVEAAPSVVQIPKRQRRRS